MDFFLSRRRQRRRQWQFDESLDLNLKCATIRFIRCALPFDDKLCSGSSYVRTIWRCISTWLRTRASATKYRLSNETLVRQVNAISHAAVRSPPVCHLNTFMSKIFADVYMVCAEFVRNEWIQHWRHEAATRKRAFRQQSQHRHRRLKVVYTNAK